MYLRLCGSVCCNIWNRLHGAFILPGEPQVDAFVQPGSAGSSFSPCGCDFQPAIATFAKQMPSSESVPWLFGTPFLEFQ